MVAVGYIRTLGCEAYSYIWDLTKWQSTEFISRHHFKSSDSNPILFSSTTWINNSPDVREKFELDFFRSIPRSISPQVIFTSRACRGELSAHSTLKITSRSHE